MNCVSKGWQVKLSLIKPLKCECLSQVHTTLQSQQNLAEKYTVQFKFWLVPRAANICKNDKLCMLGNKGKFYISEP